MPCRVLIALTLGIGASGFAGASTPVPFTVNEPVNVAGVPPVTLGPGSYVLRIVGSSAGANVVQVLNQRQDYVYTTVMTIPATRPHSDDARQILFSDAPSGSPPTLHLWFPPGQTKGHEFLNADPWSTPERVAATSSQPQLRIGSNSRVAQSAAPPADALALNEIMTRIESGKFGAARDSFRRNYFLAQNREGAATSFLLALLMIDREEAWRSLKAVEQLDPQRMRAMLRLDVYPVVESLSAGRSNLKTSRVRRFLLDFALERTDDGLARSAVLSFERHVLKGDSFPVEMALDRRRQERDKERRREAQWILARAQVDRLNECVKSLLNKVGALEYTAAKGRHGSVSLTVVLTQRRLNELDAIVARSHRAIRERHSRLERLIAQRNSAIARELASLRSALRELDRQPASLTRSQFALLRNWESAPASGVSRDLTMLAETATLPDMRPSSVLRSGDRGMVQINIAASLARLAEWARL